MVSLDVSDGLSSEHQLLLFDPLRSESYRMEIGWKIANYQIVLEGKPFSIPDVISPFCSFVFFAQSGKEEKYKYIWGFQLVRFQLIRLYCRSFFKKKKNVLNLFVNWAPPLLNRKWDILNQPQSLKDVNGHIIS